MSDNNDTLLDRIKDFADNSILDEIFIFAVIIAIIESIAQNTLKKSDKGSIRFILGLSFYIMVGYVLHYAYHNVPLSKLNVTWSCISIILAILIGYLIYDEPFDKNSVIAVIFAFLAIYFANLSSKK